MRGKIHDSAILRQPRFNVTLRVDGRIHIEVDSSEHPRPCFPQHKTEKANCSHAGRRSQCAIKSPRERLSRLCKVRRVLSAPESPHTDKDEGQIIRRRAKSDDTTCLLPRAHASTMRA